MIEVKRVDKETWKTLAKSAHEAVFAEGWNADLERISYALLMVEKEVDTVVSYCTVQELDPRTVYIQYGGTMPKYRGVRTALDSVNLMLKYLKERYEKIVTLVSNKNHTVMKWYMKHGFLITGIRYFKDIIFVEHTYEFVH